LYHSGGHQWSQSNLSASDLGAFGSSMMNWRTLAGIPALASRASRAGSVVTDKMAGSLLHVSRGPHALKMTHMAKVVCGSRVPIVWQGTGSAIP
jgi:hypothetical protein